MIARRVYVSTVAVLVSFCTLALTAFASPAITDATVSYRIRGYYTQYAASVTYTANCRIESDGTIVTVNPSNFKTSSAFAVTPGGYVFVYRSDSSNPLQSITSICFYDSQDIVVSGGYSYGDPNTPQTFVPVPQGAVKCRLTITRSGTISAAASYSKPIASPSDFGEVNSDNYHYLWSELDNVSISSAGVVSLPYQTVAYDCVMLDYVFFNSAYQCDNIAFSVLTTYTGGYFEGERLVSYNDFGIQSGYFIYDDFGRLQYQGSFVGDVYSNPYRVTSKLSTGLFSGFRLMIGAPAEVPGSEGSVSTQMHIKVYDFELDSVDISVELEADSAISGLEAVGEQLVLPTPDTSVIYSNLQNVVVQMNNQDFGNFSWFGPSGGIFVTMCVTSFTLAALAYIVFGKRG